MNAIIEQDPEFPWWIRSLAEPATVLAFVIISALAAWGERLWSVLPLAADDLARNIQMGLLVRLLREWSVLHPISASALAVPLFLMLAALSFGLYRGVMGLTST